MTHVYGSAPLGVMDPPAVLLAEPGLFAQRARRLEQLAERVESLGDFLSFMAQLAQAQHAVLEGHRPDWQPEPDAFTLALEHGMPPLGAQALSQDVDYHSELSALLDALEPHLGEAQRPLVEGLRDMSRRDIASLATEILSQGAGPDAQRGLMPLIAAALQIAWLRLTQCLPAPPPRPASEARAICPCCGSAPVASVIHRDPQRSGVRYLQCGLCGTQWYLERAKCSVCDSTGQLNYLSLEDGSGQPLLPVQAEACGDCHTYLKIVPSELDADAEPLADDLASLALDLLLAEEDRYRRSGVNPLLIVEA
ncbi:formate dehydrogenase accessory protein FdhE [Halomonas korlensis]|uniref:FdhE protein n=1 Tax=Halomonas korlensis TaxID=463301 RepID=A0A1I7GXI6_9GAMM|nr:formate dehydrogenase accessory protein FdhE [Halomonas korlensis]SFU53151.1 FdhE protein [Halomonas korlensis]